MYRTYMVKILNVRLILFELYQNKEINILETWFSEKSPFLHIIFTFFFDS